MKARLTFGTAVALLALAGAAGAQDRHDERIAEEIAANVRTYSRFTIFDHVSGEVNDGVVVLTGKVTMPYKKADIERLVARVDGVRDVESEITVLPVSSFDDDLRARVSRAIYGNPAFWRYAAMANPPIHIIVEHGRVTLTGVVNSNVERVQARSLATGLGELSVSNQLRTDRD
jgi:hyperosmotically inducible periplasmic protein